MFVRFALILSVALVVGCSSNPKDKKNQENTKPLADTLSEESQLDFALSLVDVQIEREEYKAAEQLLLKLRREENNDIRIYRRLGEVYYLLNDLELCYISRSQVVNFDEHTLEDESLLADVLLKLERYSEAEDIYNNWLSLEKTQAVVAGYNNLGFSSLLQSNFQSSEEYFLQALVLDPLNERARANLEFLLSLEGVNDENVSK